MIANVECKFLNIVNLQIKHDQSQKDILGFIIIIIHFICTLMLWGGATQEILIQNWAILIVISAVPKPGRSGGT